MIAKLVGTKMRENQSGRTESLFIWLSEVLIEQWLFFSFFFSSSLWSPEVESVSCSAVSDCLQPHGL